MDGAVCPSLLFLSRQVFFQRPTTPEKGSFLINTVTQRDYANLKALGCAPPAITVDGTHGVPQRVEIDGNTATLRLNRVNPLGGLAPVAVGELHDLTSYMTSDCYTLLRLPRQLCTLPLNRLSIVCDPEMPRPDDLSKTITRPRKMAAKFRALPSGLGRVALKSLELRGLPRLAAVPPLRGAERTLTRLRVDKCGGAKVDLTMLPILEQLSLGDVTVTYSDSTPDRLTHLSLCGVDWMRPHEFPELLAAQTRLHHLHIEGTDLDVIPPMPAADTTLRYVAIINCPLLEHVPPFPVVWRIAIARCPRLSAPDAIKPEIRDGMDMGGAAALWADEGRRGQTKVDEDGFPPQYDDEDAGMAAMREMYRRR